ncbi:MAG TPA: hypothetical protein QGF58_11175 [Myxococcota bacterium]|nr:hypothetical protein [Myxococcota bacterium]
MRLFCGIAPGLEEALAEEVRALSERQVVPVEGGVELDGDLVDAAGLALWSRCAGEVLIRVGEIHAPSLEHFRKELSRLPWKDFVHPGQPTDVRVYGGRLGRTDVVAKKVVHTVRDALRGPRRAKRPPTHAVGVRVRLLGKRAVVSIVAATGLHKRGWRRATARAPIRENLASACLVAAGWQPGVPLYDPFCGSGTFAIEALRWGAAPGIGQTPPVTTLPAFPPRTWKRMLDEARASRPEPTEVLAADRDVGAVRAARANAERAGVALPILQKDISASLDRKLTGPGLVMINPPYGRRVAENVKLAPLYRRAGDALGQQVQGWRVAVVCADAALAGRLGRNVEAIARFSNGGISVSLFIGQTR